MHVNQMFKGEYVSAAEFGGKTPTLTIRDVVLVRMEDEKKGEREKGVIHFMETDRGWVLNRTNALCLAAMFGPETDKWSGKRVKLHAVEVQLGKERVPGIRVVGSPDLDRPVTFELKLPRKRPQKVTMAVTKKETAPPPEPPDNPEPTDPAAEPVEF